MLAEWKKVFQGNFPQGKERVFEVNLEEDAVYRLFQPLLNWEARASLTKDEQNRSMMLVGSLHEHQTVNSFLQDPKDTRSGFERGLASSAGQIDCYAIRFWSTAVGKIS